MGDVGDVGSIADPSHVPCSCLGALVWMPRVFSPSDASLQQIHTVSSVAATQDGTSRDHITETSDPQIVRTNKNGEAQQQPRPARLAAMPAGPPDGEDGRYLGPAGTSRWMLDCLEGRRGRRMVIRCDEQPGRIIVVCWTHQECLSNLRQGNFGCRRPTNCRSQHPERQNRHQHGPRRHRYGQHQYGQHRY